MRELKLGLALGAGGTKGAAHVGVLRELDDAGIRIDAIAGTSIGALYGAAYAAGYTPAFIEAGIRECPHRDVLRFFQHRLRIRHPNRLARRFYDALAGLQIESLATPFAATASDIVRHCPVVIDHGPVIDALEASIAIPFLARPVAHQGRYLLDGGFWDAAPVDAALQIGADVIVAVELGDPYTLPEPLRRPASWMARRLSGVGNRRTLAGLPFTIEAMARETVPGRTANLVLRPLISRRSNSPFRMMQCLEAGAAAARAALPAIRALLAGEPLPAPAAAYAPSAAAELEGGGI
ncbi:MAG: patatin-like phospholipase family protein [Dehalococcoidia bacterium]|nr:patatin-like phospholipase family protein [Dehalococcoidia bacterium]